MRQSELAAKLRELLATLPVKSECPGTLTEEASKLGERLATIQGRYQSTARQPHMRPSGTVKASAELKILERHAAALVRHINSMHADAIQAMPSGLFDLQEEVETWVVRAKRARGLLAKEKLIPPPKGHRKNCELAITRQVARVYERLTGRPFGRQCNPRNVGDYEVTYRDVGRPAKLLDGVFRILSIKASAENMIRMYLKAKKIG